MSASKLSNYAVKVFKEKPIIRGVLAYIIIWPTSNLIQQTFQGRRFPDYDWKQAARFSFFGGIVVAPILYGWIRFSSHVWPRSSLKTAVHKAVTEQFTYGPFAICCFLFGMSLLERKTIEQAAAEVRAKFMPTWKVAFCFWPIVQTINFRFIPERNRVPYVSVASLGWTSFLSYMKHLDTQKLDDQKLLPKAQKDSVMHHPTTTATPQKTIVQQIM